MRKLVMLMLAAFCSTSLYADNWPAWRGADGTGVASETKSPTKWSATDNIRWKIPLPEPGNSTPIIWENRVFLTQGLDGGKRRALITLDRETGETLWQRELECTVKETSHRQNPPCSASVTTDGKVVYAQFGSSGVVAYDFSGKQLWHRDLGPVIHLFGNGSSPVIYKDLLFVFHGPGKPSILYALNRHDGKTVWKSEEVPINNNLFGSWSTPVMVRASGQDELIMPLPGEKVGGVGLFKAFNPMTGDALWNCDGLGTELYAMPIIGRDGKVVVGISGHNGPTMAVRTGGKGNVTDSHQLWKADMKIPQRIGSGIIHDGLLYIADATGIMECIDLESGQVIWKERLGGNLWGSILLTGGKLYVTNLEGDTFVVKTGRQFELLAKNSVGEATYAALAPSGAELFLRTHKHLYCIKESTSE